MKKWIVRITIAVIAFCLCSGVAFAVDRKQLGTSANVSGGKTKIYDVSTQNLEIWRPSMILLSARDSAVFFQVYIDQNVSSIAEFSFVDSISTTPTKALNHALFDAVFAKTSADTLKVFANHVFLGS